MRLRILLFAASALVLVAGLSAGLALYATAEDEPEATASSALLLAPGTSKIYNRELQRFGGKSAVLFDDALRWFSDLWRGKALGKTVALLSALAALGLYLAARKT
jgi:hypothetical protein